MTDLRIIWGNATVLPGVYTLNAVLPDWPVPVGVLWYRMILNHTTAEVLNLFVVEKLRKKGIASSLVKHLGGLKFPNLKRLYTETGTDMGTPFMIATGWEQQGDGWFKQLP